MRAAPKIAALLAATALTALAMAALLPALALAKGETAQGYIEELKKPTHIGAIAAGGSHQVVWFTETGTPNAVGWMTRQRKVHRHPLPTGVVPRHLIVGPEGSAWFSYTRGAVAALESAAGGIGTVTSAGKVSLFDEPPNPSGPPSELAFSTEGVLWFDHAGPYAPGGAGIGKITATGVITEYTAGLPVEAKVGSLTTATDGNIWFADTSAARAIGRITPTGEITEFGGLPPQGTSALAGPTGAGSALWFAANPSSGPALERISTAGQITRFTKGLAANADGIGPILGEPGSGDAWFRVERHAGLGTTASPDGPLAIGHVDAAGKVTEYSRCIRAMPAAFGVRELINGPDGNVWFANLPSGKPRHFRYRAAASIGYITPGGKITELRYGLFLRSEPKDLTSAAGSVWFVDGHNGLIGQIRPPKSPANTVSALSLLGGKGTRPRLEIEAPGPGKLVFEETGKRPGLGSSATVARSCGTVDIAVPMGRPLVETLHRAGVVFINGLLTFIPRGGTPFTTRVYVEVGVAGK